MPDPEQTRVGSGGGAPTQIWMHHNPPSRSLQLCGPNLDTVPIPGLSVCPRVAVIGTLPRDAAGGRAAFFGACHLPQTGREVQGRRALVI